MWEIQLKDVMSVKQTWMHSNGPAHINLGWNMVKYGSRLQIVGQSDKMQGNVSK